MYIYIYTRSDGPGRPERSGWTTIIQLIIVIIIMIIMTDNDNDSNGNNTMNSSSSSSSSSSSNSNNTKRPERSGWRRPAPRPPRRVLRARPPLKYIYIYIYI